MTTTRKSTTAGQRISLLMPGPGSVPETLLAANKAPRQARDTYQSRSGVPPKRRVVQRNTRLRSPSNTPGQKIRLILWSSRQEEEPRLRHRSEPIEQRAAQDL